MIDFEFPDLDSICLVRDMVRKIVNINTSTDTSDIFELNNELNDVCINQKNTIYLSENQARALDLILDLFKDVNADECNVAFDISRVFKKTITPSDVPRFIEMLKDFQLIQYLSNDTVQALVIQDLFCDWCSQNGDTPIAHDCMELIVSTGNLAWKDAYTWLCNNSSSNYTDVDKELDKLKEAICQIS